MKKHIILIVLLLGVVFAVRAQEGSGECKLPGTYDYVRVAYFNDSKDCKGAACKNGEGHLLVSNQSGVLITSLHVKVVCVHTWKEKVPKKVQKMVTTSEYGEVPVTEEKEVWENRSASNVLVDDDIHDIPYTQTTQYTHTERGRIKGGPHREDGYNGRYDNRYEYKVTIGNPICTPIGGTE